VLLDRTSSIKIYVLGKKKGERGGFFIKSRFRVEKDERMVLPSEILKVCFFWVKEVLAKRKL
jgi:hypothetical protein